MGNSLEWPEFWPLVVGLQECSKVHPCGIVTYVAWVFGMRKHPNCGYVCPELLESSPKVAWNGGLAATIIDIKQSKINRKVGTGNFKNGHDIHY